MAIFGPATNSLARQSTKKKPTATLKPQSSIKLQPPVQQQQQAPQNVAQTNDNVGSVRPPMGVRTGPTNPVPLNMTQSTTPPNPPIPTNIMSYDEWAKRRKTQNLSTDNSDYERNMAQINTAPSNIGMGVTNIPRGQMSINIAQPPGGIATGPSEMPINVGQPPSNMQPGQIGTWNPRDPQFQNNSILSGPWAGKTQGWANDVMDRSNGSTANFSGLFGEPNADKSMISSIQDRYNQRMPVGVSGNQQVMNHEQELKNRGFLQGYK